MVFQIRAAGFASAILFSPPLLSACTPTTPVGTEASSVTAQDVTARVVGVDRAARTMTLMGQDGRQATVDVPPEVRNFTQVMVGDTVRIAYRARVDILVTGAAAPINGVEVLVGGTRSEAGQMPSGILGTQTRRTVQVVSVDRGTHTVTYREPDGTINSFTAVNAEHFALVDGLRPGTNVMVTVTRAIAASVDRV